MSNYNNDDFLRRVEFHRRSLKERAAALELSCLKEEVERRDVLNTTAYFMSGKEKQREIRAAAYSKSLRRFGF